MFEFEAGVQRVLMIGHRARAATRCTTWLVFDSISAGRIRASEAGDIQGVPRQLPHQQGKQGGYFVAPLTYILDGDNTYFSCGADDSE